MKSGEKTKNKETSLFIRQNKISPAMAEVSYAREKSRIRDQVLDTYLRFYTKDMNGTRFSLSRLAPLGLVSAVLIIAAVYLIMPQKGGQTNNPGTTTAILKAAVTFVEGDAEVMLEDGRWADLGEQKTLEEGDTLRIVGEGKGILTLDDGSAIRLGSDTTIKLTSLNAQNILITNEEGEVYTRIEASERVFTVATADATYTSLGTAYKTVQRFDKKGVYVYESKVVVAPKNIEKIIVNEGEKFFLSEEKPTIITATEIEDSFTQWNKDADKQEFGTEAALFKKLEQEKFQLQEQENNKMQVQNVEAEQNTENNEQQNQAVVSISLGGHADLNAGGIVVNWVPTNIDTSQGFKVVYSKTNGSPTYGVDSAQYVGDSNARSAVLSLKNGVTYYIRVCRYTGNGCDTYSNVMIITAPVQNEEQKQSKVQSISLSGLSNGKVNWGVNGYSPEGFKVVYSKVTGPTYPTRSSDKSIYESNPNSTYMQLSAFDGSGTYYVRVCEYLGGVCGVYSNEVAIEL